MFLAALNLKNTRSITNLYHRDLDGKTAIDYGSQDAEIASYQEIFDRSANEIDYDV